MTYISDILYWISTGLLVPVIVLLILLFLRSLLLIGNFFGQYQSIRKNQKQFSQIFGKDAARVRLEDLEGILPENSRSPLLSTARQILENRDSEARRMQLITDYEIIADKDLSVSKILAKMGPMLGLMGTLIPMGPALVGLSTGDIASMAYNMQVAFATTVVGLFSAAIGFITQQMKQRWYTQDITRLELISNLIDEDRNEEKKKTDRQ